MDKIAGEPEGFGRTFHVPLDDEHLLSLGKVAALFGALEYALDLLIIINSGEMSPPVADLMLAGKTLATKVDMLVKLVELSRDPQRIELVKAARQAINQVRAERNDIVHGAWGYPALAFETQPNLKVERRTVEPLMPIAKSKTSTRAPVRADELEAIVERAEKACRALWDCYAPPGATLPTTFCHL